MLDRDELHGNGAAPRPSGPSATGPDGEQQVAMVWSTDATSVWRRVPHPLGGMPKGTLDELREERARRGWWLLGRLGIENSPCEVEVFRSVEGERSLALVWLLDAALEFLLEDAPALLRFLSEVAPLLAEARATWNE
jgi:hypothetical protein